MITSRVSIFSRRALFISFLFVLIFVLLMSRFFYLKIFEDNFLDEQISSRFISEKFLLAKRGRIVDRNNNVLAFDVGSYSVGLDLSKFKADKEIIENLSELLDLDEEFLTEKIEKKKGYIEIKKHISVDTQKKINQLVKNGIFFKENLRRSYPQKHISSHVVGITDTDRKGIQGVELVLNDKLRGKPGRYIKSGIGRERVVSMEGEIVRLTIDIRLQSIAYEELRRAVTKTGANSGSIILVDTESADILALTNFPSFDPSNRKNIQDLSVFRNRATLDTFEPGSVIKPLAMSAILDSKKFDSSFKVDTSPGWIEIGGYRTKDFKNYGNLNLSEIISNSSNVGMIKLCTDQESSHLMKYYSNFGLGRYPTNILIPSREGFLPLGTELKLRDKVSSCYGYGISMTGLQVAQAYLVFAKEGIFRELNLFLDDNVTGLNEQRRVLSIDTAKEINKMLVQTVQSESGTAKRAKISGIMIAGKTGTAQKEEKEGRSYTATFSGFAPALKPKILAVVVLHGLKGKDHSGGSVAAPVFSKIISQSLNILEIEI